MKEAQLIYWHNSRGEIEVYHVDAFRNYLNGWSGESVKTEREDSGNTKSVPARENTPETNDKKPIRGLEKKDTSTTEPATSII